MWKAPGDIIPLNMCTINQGHMMYDSWDIKSKEQSQKDKVFCHFGPFLLPFDPPNNPKNQILKKKKKKKMPEGIIFHFPLYILYFTTNNNHDVWFLIYQARQKEFFVVLGYFLPFNPSNNPENQNFEKMKNVHADIIIYKSVP